MIPVLLFPQIDPVIVQIGPFGIRWYAMAYIAGLVLGWRLMRRLVTMPPAVASSLQVDDFLTWATLGVVLGGRLGYVLFYQPAVFIAEPLRILQVWTGGMSFHGGMLGVTIATVWFCRRNAIPLLGFTDRLAVVVPIGLCFGRLANFINGELWGRPAPAVPWAMVFPNGGPLPRHPSQLYEAGLEGILLFAILAVMIRIGALKRPGLILGSFIAIYAIARIISELFREPDPQLGFLWGGLTMGMLLSVPMIIAGAILIVMAWRKAPEHLQKSI